MPNILLINPVTSGKYIHQNRGGLDRLIGPILRRSLHKDFTFPTSNLSTLLPPITLIGLKELFEQFVDVDIIDEQVKSVDYTVRPDLVCITATTLQLERAKEISHIFRMEGIPTAIGGVHSTARPQDCVDDFDVICQGEAEGYVQEMVSDLLANNLKKNYKCDKSVPMDNVPFYNYDIGAGSYLPVHVVSFSRGCVYSCDFCSISALFGGYRTRSVTSVIKEITRVGAPLLWFPDATLTANIKIAHELFSALKAQNVRWIGQITMNIMDKDWLIDLMAESGCLTVSVGFESLSEGNLRSANKYQNRVDDYYGFIDKLHRRGIAVEGNFVFGFDEDYDDVFEKTAKFIVDAGVDLPQIFVLTPYPNTKLFSRLDLAGRIVDKNWTHYDNMHFRHLPVFEPKNISRKDLRDGCSYVEREVFSLRNTLRRLRFTSIDQLPIIIGNYILSTRIRNNGFSDVDLNTKPNNLKNTLHEGFEINSNLIGH